MRIKKYGMLPCIPFFIGMMVLICVTAGFRYRSIHDRSNDRSIHSKAIQMNDKRAEMDNIAAKSQENSVQSQETEQQSTLNSQEEIYSQVLRFHIRAVSDKEEDQKLKLKVKTQVVNYLQWLLADCKSKESCEEKIEENLDFIEKMSASICQKAGKPAEVHAYLTREEFPLKQYGDMIFPSGIYDALRVDLGAAKGKNWWCMMYPSLCMVDGVIEEVPLESKEELKKNLSEEAYDSLFWKTEQRKQDSYAAAEEEKQDSSIATEANHKGADDSEKTSGKVQYHIKWKAIEMIQDYLYINSSR